MFPGEYTFTAFVTDARGASSSETQALLVRVRSKFWGDVIAFGADYLSNIVLVGLILLGVVVAGIYAKTYVTHLIIKKRLEIVGAKNVTDRSFEILRKDIEKHITRLKKAKKNRKLTEEEIIFLGEFEKDLVSAQEIIIGEIKDIIDKK